MDFESLKSQMASAAESFHYDLDQMAEEDEYINNPDYVIPKKDLDIVEAPLMNHILKKCDEGTGDYSEKIKKDLDIVEAPPMNHILKKCDEGTGDHSEKIMPSHTEIVTNEHLSSFDKGTEVGEMCSEILRSETSQVDSIVPSEDHSPALSESNSREWSLLDLPMMNIWDQPEKDSSSLYGENRNEEEEDQVTKAQTKNVSKAGAHMLSLVEMFMQQPEKQKDLNKYVEQNKEDKSLAKKDSMSKLDGLHDSDDDGSICGEKMSSTSKNAYSSVIASVNNIDDDAFTQLLQETKKVKESFGYKSPLICSNQLSSTENLEEYAPPGRKTKWFDVFDESTTTSVTQNQNDKTRLFKSFDNLIESKNTSENKKTPWINNIVNDPNIQSLSKNIQSKFRQFVQNQDVSVFSRDEILHNQTASSPIVDDEYTSILVESASFEDEEMAELERMQRNRRPLQILFSLLKKNRNNVFVGFTMFFITYVYFYARRSGLKGV